MTGIEVVKQITIIDPCHLERLTLLFIAQVGS